MCIFSFDLQKYEIKARKQKIFPRKESFLPCFFKNYRNFAAKRTECIMNSNQVEFSTYCIGNVASALNMNQTEVYHRLKSSGILMDYIVGCYDVLHTFGRMYLTEDITSLMKEKGAL